MKMTMAIPTDTPKHQDLIYDVGLHKGEDAEMYLRKGFRVVGFEADPDLAAYCRKTLKEFITEGQLTIVEGAIVAVDVKRTRENKVRFFKNRDILVWGTTNPGWADRNTQLGTSSSIIEVDAVDFADSIKQHGVPYYMKIDIEGCDLVCVRALDGFKERPTYISLESDKTSLKNIRHEIDLLIELGYSSFKAVEQSAIHLAQSPPDPPREGNDNYVAKHILAGSSGLFGLELEGKWKRRHGILKQYCFIRMGYLLLGDDGVMRKWRFRGACELRSLTARFIGRFTHAAVPGWYDTHARHSSFDVSFRSGF